MKMCFIKTVSFLLMALMVDSCNQNKSTPAETPVVTNPVVAVNPPSFNADSAYHYVARQLAFGPRSMNTTAHERCAAFLISEAKKFADTVYIQKFQVKAYDGVTLKGTNIIASFNTAATNRILLCSHWDSRPWADQDDSATTLPILGANDGASGVAVLLEAARAIRTSPLKNIGVDVFFIDAEDYGKTGYEDSYCLGAQYWSKTPHLSGYKADFGILLDMVGAPNAVFAREGNSAFHAGWVVDKVWANARALGYENHFSTMPVPAITDDHLYINTIIKIPTIDIIQYDPTSPSGTFGHYWHTHDDNMNAIDKNTLLAVGRTVLYTVYQYDAEIKAQP